MRLAATRLNLPPDLIHFLMATLAKLQARGQSGKGIRTPFMGPHLITLYVPNKSRFEIAFKISSIRPH